MQFLAICQKEKEDVKRKHTGISMSEYSEQEISGSASVAVVVELEKLSTTEEEAQVEF